MAWPQSTFWGHGTTDPGAVLTAKEELGADVRLVTGPAAAHFHPKLYLVQHTERLVVLAGSGNLTRGGLRDNVEQFEQLSIKAGEKRERDHVTRFNKIWEQGVPLAELRETEFWEQWLEQWEQRSAIQRQAAELDAALDDSVAALRRPRSHYAGRDRR